MFHFHETTQRRAGLAGFVLLCIVPTIATASWCAWQHTPAHLDAVAARLSEELRLDVSLARVRHLCPGVDVYDELRVSDPETGQEIAYCRMLRAEWTEATDAQGQRRETLVLTAVEPRMNAARLDRLGGALDRLLRWQIARRAVDVRFHAGRLVLKSGDNAYTLTDPWATLQSHSSGAEARCDFRLPDVPMSRPIRIRLVRNRKTLPSTGGFELDARSAAVPCGLLALAIPSFESLGARASFAGLITATESADGWSGEVSNARLSDVDLDRLISDRFPHCLSGVARADIRLARFRDGRIAFAEGNLAAARGLISRSLMAAAVEHLGLFEGPPPRISGSVVPYEMLAVAYRLDSTGLQLRGQCPGVGRRAILTDRDSFLLGDPLSQPQSILALVQTLTSDDGPRIAVSGSSQRLMRRLYIGESAEPTDIEPSEATALRDDGLPPR